MVIPQVGGCALVELTAVQGGEGGKGSWSFCSRDLSPMRPRFLPAREDTLAVHLLGGLRLGHRGDTCSLHFGSEIHFL